MGRVRPPTSIIDKAKRASYLTDDPVQRRENGRFAAFFALFIVVAIVRGAFARFWPGKRGANVFGRNGIGKVENARLVSEVRLGDEEGLRFVERPPTQGLPAEGGGDQCARASVRGAERGATPGEDRRVSRRARGRQDV